MLNAHIWSQRLVTSFEIIHELVDQAFGNHFASMLR